MYVYVDGKHNRPVWLDIKIGDFVSHKLEEGSRGVLCRAYTTLNRGVVEWDTDRGVVSQDEYLSSLVKVK